LIIFFGEKHKQKKARQNEADGIDKKEPITTGGGIVQLTTEATGDTETTPQQLVDGCQVCEDVMVQNATDVSQNEPVTEMKHKEIEKDTITEALEH
jgi:hypothetical protein